MQQVVRIYQTVFFLVGQLQDGGQKQYSWTSRPKALSSGNRVGHCDGTMLDMEIPI